METVKLLQCSRCKRIRPVKFYGDPRDDHHSCCPKGEMIDVTESYLKKIELHRKEVKERIKKKERN